MLLLTDANARVDALHQVSKQSRQSESEVGMCIHILDPIQLPHVFEDPTPWKCCPMERSFLERPRYDK